MAGVLALFLNLLLVPSLIAIAAGHLVLYQTKKNDATRGRGIAFMGMVMGYVALAKELYLYWRY